MSGSRFPARSLSRPNLRFRPETRSGCDEYPDAPGRQGDPQDVKPAIHRFPQTDQVGLSENGELAALPFIHRQLGRGEISGRVRLHFDEHQNAAVAGDQVNLPQPGPDVPGDDLITPLSQVARALFLSPPPQRVTRIGGEGFDPVPESHHASGPA